MLAKIWELIDCPNPGSKGSGYYCKRTGEATQLCWTYANTVVVYDPDYEVRLLPC